MTGGFGKLDKQGAGEQVVAGQGGAEAFIESTADLVGPGFFALAVGVDFEAGWVDADAHGSRHILNK